MQQAADRAQNNPQGANRDAMLKPVIFIEFFTKLVAVLSAAIGLAVLAGWAFDLTLLKRGFFSVVEMKANTAAGLLLAGCGLLMVGDQQSRPVRRLALVLALVVAALGLATLSEHAFGYALGIDELLFRDTLGGLNNYPHGRMAPSSALGFVGIGLALATLTQPGLRAVAIFSASVVAVIGAVSFLSHILNAKVVIANGLLPPVAVHTAITFSLLGAALLLATYQSASDKERNRIALASVEVKIIVSFLIALLLLAVGGGLNYRATTEYSNAARVLSHSQEIRTVLSRLYGDISDAESAQRNFLITGQQSQLDVYNRLAARIGRQHEALNRLVEDNPEQFKNAADLRKLARRFIDLLERGTEFYKTQGFASARDFVASGEGFSAVQAIRNLTDRMDGIEEKRQNDLEAGLTHRRQLTLVLLLLILLVAICAFALVMRGIHIEMMARSESEKALVGAMEAADLANRAKSTFLATMSHEIRTPMNGMFGMLELLGLSKLDDEQRNKLQLVRESGKSLLRIIDDILDFSRIEAGKLELRPEITSIKQLIDDTLNIYSGIGSSKGLRLESSVDPKISPALLVDPLRLRQILNNFVNNAVKFTAQGSIELSARLIERKEGKDLVQFSVKDTGIGISPDNQALLFHPFSQGDGETTRRYGGTGLGLTICRRLAVLMGGTVEMESELGSGTTMTLKLLLPIADSKFMPKKDLESAINQAASKAQLLRAAPSVADAQSAGSLALLVDDNETNRNLLMRQIHALGYAVESAIDGIDALDKWKSGRFGIIFTDCNMPEMDGYELARTIRQLEEANGRKRTPIIACTANALSGEAETCLAAGMDDYLAKPIELAQLQEKLGRWLSVQKPTTTPD